MIKTIRSKIIISYFIIAFIALIVTWFITSFRTSDYLEHQSKIKIKDISQKIVDFVSSDSTDDYNTAYNHIKTIANLSDSRITLIDSSGKVWFDSEVDISKVNNIENHLNRIIRIGIGNNINSS